MNHVQPETPETDTDTTRPIEPDRLRWRCDPAVFPFKTTDEVEPIRTVVGQDAAVEALRFGLKCRAHGQNVFVQGLSGTGRMTLVRRLLEEIQPSCPLTVDRAYVHNFVDPMRPRLLTLPRGRVNAFAEAVDELATFLEEDLAAALESESASARRGVLEKETERRVKETVGSLEKALEAEGLALMTVSAGRMTRMALFPRLDGKPVDPEQYAAERASGAVTPEEFDRVLAAITARQEDLRVVQTQIREIMGDHVDAAHQLIKEDARGVVAPQFDDLKAEFPSEDVGEFLDAVLDDLIEHQVIHLGDEALSFNHYRVNPVHAHEDGAGCPIVAESTPSYSNLVGGFDRRVIGAEVQAPDHLSIRRGSLLESDGGFIILDAREVLSEPGSWRAIVRTLRDNRIEITPPESPLAILQTLLKPEPIDVNIKVVLLGDREVFELLTQLDEDFGHLFKVVAEFDSTIARVPESYEHYASIIKRIADDDGLPAFSREAVAALVEHGARIASSREKLTARFSRVADIAREAAFLTKEAGRLVVGAEDITTTVLRTRRRADLRSRRFRELLADGTIHVDTSGAVIGQINGLAVIHSGPLTYGFPARITASIGPGSAGVVNIERESALSGAIHTKGFFILAGLLRNLLESDHPLSFEAALAFEQSYGGIDGDSASGAEICCLMSALTRSPIRQDLAMTGAIDQLGHVQAIGGVNEKIEGFFDTCRDRGLTGTQGVVIPASNVGDLMLRADVVEAVRAGQFHVRAVKTISQAMELLMERQLHGDHDESLLSLARARSREFWRRAARKGDD